LGHIISKQGIAVDPENIKAIMNWPTPKNVTDVRSFMGLVDIIKDSLRDSPRLVIQ
jgi:hypothetical protein